MEGVTAWLTLQSSRQPHHPYSRRKRTKYELFKATYNRLKNKKSPLKSHLIYEGGGRQVDQPLNRATTPLILTPKKRNKNAFIKE